MQIYAYTLSLSVVEYQTAVLRGDMDAAREILESVPKSEVNKVARFLEAMGRKGATGGAGNGMKVVDLGCGTGRNTALLIDAEGIEEVVAVDVSSGMLEVAKGRLVLEGSAVHEDGKSDVDAVYTAEVNGKEITFGIYDVE